jgi:hypothetical protein
VDRNLNSGRERGHRTDGAHRQDGCGRAAIGVVVLRPRTLAPRMHRVDGAASPCVETGADAERLTGEALAGQELVIGEGVEIHGALNAPLLSGAKIAASLCGLNLAKPAAILSARIAYVSHSLQPCCRDLRHCRLETLAELDTRQRLALSTSAAAAESNRKPVRRQHFFCIGKRENGLRRSIQTQQPTCESISHRAPGLGFAHARTRLSSIT